MPKNEATSVATMPSECLLFVGTAGPKVRTHPSQAQTKASVTRNLQNLCRRTNSLRWSLHVHSAGLASRQHQPGRGLAEYAFDFIAAKYLPGEQALAQVERFHLDSVGCALAALAIGANSPRLLRREALSYARGDNQQGASCFGSTVPVARKKPSLTAPPFENSTPMAPISGITPCQDKPQSGTAATISIP